MSRPPLTSAQYRLLSFIDLFIDSYGWAPSYREICAGTALKSTSSVSWQLNALEAKGYIRRGEHHHIRALSVIP